ncbi:MAG: UDP-2,3-diacylglucosamine diphosphatase [Mucinivorans sp.]
MIYFASDTHLGLNYGAFTPRERELYFVEWLRGIEPTCEVLFLVGDIFDFWFEYKRVIPKGFTRLFGQLSAMSDRGIVIHFFAGNHDQWVEDYFTKEIGVKVYTQPTLFELQGRKVLVAHGDALGKSDFWGVMLGKLFRSGTARWLFQRCLHPDMALRFGYWWSGHNRLSRGNIGHSFRGQTEPLVRWAQAEQDGSIDYFVFGHLHTPTIFALSHGQVVVLGEWVVNPTYAVMDGGQIELIKI